MSIYKNLQFTIHVQKSSIACHEFLSLKKSQKNIQFFSSFPFFLISIAERYADNFNEEAIGIFNS